MVESIDFSDNIAYQGGNIVYCNHKSLFPLSSGEDYWTIKLRGLFVGLDQSCPGSKIHAALWLMWEATGRLSFPCHTEDKGLEYRHDEDLYSGSLPKGFLFNLWNLCGISRICFSW